MIDIILAFDNLNTRGGQFISECLDDINVFFSTKTYNVQTLTSHDINAKNIHDCTINLTSLIFVPYCHGNDSCLGNINSDVFVSTTVNIKNFSNSFFYTFSCSSGINLGQELIDNNCKCFFGYNKTIYNINGYSQFKECANLGLFLFVDGYDTDTILIEMKKKYTEKVFELSKIDFFSAAYLRSNKDSLIKIGKNITIDNLINNN